MLLAPTGLNGRDPITGPEAGGRLGVSYQRIQQLLIDHLTIFKCPQDGSSRVLARILGSDSCEVGWNSTPPMRPASICYRVRDK